MTERAQRIMEAFYLTFADKRQDFIIQKLNNDALAAAIREIANCFEWDSYGLAELCADDFNEIADELEELE
jgi:hypothetical protein